MTVIGAGSYSIKSVNYNNDITVIKDNQDTDTNVSSSSINSKLDNAEAASDKSVDDVYADDEQVKEADKTPRLRIKKPQMSVTSSPTPSRSATVTVLFTKSKTLKWQIPFRLNLTS